MARIITPRQRHDAVRYVRSFTWLDDPGAGFRFDCDQQGTVVIAELPEAARENYAACVSGQLAVQDDGVVVEQWTWTEDAVLACDCGEQVQLHGFTNTCPRCRADYNMSGQRLAPRSQWGEDTGESLADILRIP